MLFIDAHTLPRCRTHYAWRSHQNNGRDPSEFAPDLAHLPTTHRDAEQPLDPSVQWCGQACLSVAIICKEHGLAMSKLV